MAENEDGQEKSEEPTAKRLDEARRKGQVARSRELNTMAVTLAGALFLAVMGDRFGRGLADLMGRQFTLGRREFFDPNAMLLNLASAVQDALLLLLPFLLLTALVAVLASMALGGFSFSAEALAPKLSKLNPLKGLKRIFSPHGVMELGKAVVKFVLIGGVTVALLWYRRDDFLRLGKLEAVPALLQLAEMVALSVVVLASSLVLLAMVDVPFQLWEHKRQLKMTRQEIRDELKETDGRPEVKGRIRNLQREMAQQRMMDEVPKADVIVTNPTHYAVALRYDQRHMSAPMMVAKGRDMIAHNIRRVGKDARVPIVESPLLARALYFNAEVGDAIPAGLYLAVARLLAYVFQLNIHVTEGGEAPSRPEDLPVPDEFRTE